MSGVCVQLTQAADKRLVDFTKFAEQFIPVILLFLADRPLKRVRTKVKKAGGQKPSSFPSQSSAKDGCHAEVRCCVEVLSML